MALVSLLEQARLLNRELLRTYKLQQQMFDQLPALLEGFKAMSDTADAIKAQIVAIGKDVVEVDGDIQELQDKISAINGLPTPQEFDEIKTMLADLKDRSRKAADKVPEPA